jgi:hypothetical protein
MVPAVETKNVNASPIFLKAIDAALKVNEPDRPQTIGQWRSLLAGGAAQGRPAVVMATTGSTTGPVQKKSKLLPVLASVFALAAVAVGIWTWQERLLQ